MSHLQNLLQLGKLAFDDISGDKIECKKYVREHSAPNLRFQNATSACVLGGEDPGDLPTSLQHILIKWNDSLPPFDMAFYTAICCDPTFDLAYKSLQTFSVRLLDEPSNQSMLAAWEAKLASWRKQILIAYAALVRPSIWSQEASSRRRNVPEDLQMKKADIDSIWNKYSKSGQTSQRLSMLQPLL